MYNRCGKMPTGLNVKIKTIIIGLNRRDMHKYTIKDIGLPKQIEDQFLGFIEYSKSFPNGTPDLILVGCPVDTLPRLLQAIANEMRVTLKLMEGRIFEELVFHAETAPMYYELECPITPFGTVFSAENIDKVPNGIKESFHYTIDLTK